MRSTKRDLVNCSRLFDPNKLEFPILASVLWDQRLENINNRS